MLAEKDYFFRRLDFDDYVNKNMKIIQKITNTDFAVQYGINKRKQLGMDLRRCKAGVDIQQLVPKEVKCVFFTDCKGTEMPKLPDTVEVLFFNTCNFKKFYFPKSLKELYFEYLPEMKKLPDFSGLKHLWALDINRMPVLKFLPKNLPDSIISLNLRKNRVLKSSLNNLPKNLEQLYISECYNILNIPSFNKLNKLKFFTAEYPSMVVDLKVSPKLENIKGFVVDIRVKTIKFFTPGYLDILEKIKLFYKLQKKS